VSAVRKARGSENPVDLRLSDSGGQTLRRRLGQPRGRTNTAALIAVLAAATAVATGVTPASAAASPMAATPIANTTSSTHTVTLITGDRVTVRSAPGGGATESVDPGSPDKAFQTFTIKGDQYLVPAQVQPYLGRTLGISLFDVSALVRADLGPSSQLPVVMAFQPGVTPDAPSGVTVTSVSGGTAQGYLTPSSEAAFDQGLRARIGADVAAGRPAGTSPLFTGLASLDLATGTAPGGVVQPDFPLHIMQVNATDLTGQAADGLALVMNTDSLQDFYDFVPVVNGVGRVAAPAGDYTVIVGFTDFDANGNTTAFRLTTDLNVVESATGPATIASLDERDSTNQVVATTPKPTTQDALLVNVARVDATGAARSQGALSFDGSPAIYVNPQPAPTVGSLRYLVWDVAQSANPADHYRYDLAYESPDIPADETFAPKANQIATLHDRLYADPAQTVDDDPVATPIDPVAGQYGYWIEGGTAPGGSEFTEYLGTQAGGGWRLTTQLSDQAFMLSDPRVFTAGRTYSVDWGRGPVVPGLGQWSAAIAPCLVCLADDTLLVTVPEAHDDVPDHSDLGDDVDTKTHFTLYSGDVQEFDGDATNGVDLTGVPATPLTFRAILDVDRTGLPGVSHAVRTHTEETVQYSPTDTGHQQPGDDCRVGASTCQVLGAMSLNYHLSGLDLTNTTRSPVQVLGLTVGHQSYGGIGVTSPITSATVSVSFDNGVTWQAVRVTGHSGNYVAAWHNQPGTSPSLLVTAHDAAGNAISQTIIAAYSSAAGK
jgi:hypothetical protein